MCLLVADVAAPSSRFPSVPSHAVANFPDCFYNFTLYQHRVVGPVRKGVHVAYLIRDMNFVGEYLCTVPSRYRFSEKLSLHFAEKLFERSRSLFVGVGNGQESVPF